MAIKRCWRCPSKNVMGKTWKDSKSSKLGRSKDRPTKMSPYNRNKKCEDETRQ